MPILQIIQKLRYTSSHVERTLEKSLENYGFPLPQAVIERQLDDLESGLWRTVKRRNKLLSYGKTFFGGDIKEIIKSFKYYANEKKLLSTLNSNHIYTEEITLEEGPAKIYVINYPDLRGGGPLFTIDLGLEEHIELFLRVIRKNYREINLRKLRNMLLECDSEIYKDEMDAMIKQEVSDFSPLKITNYVNMIVKYFSE